MSGSDLAEYIKDCEFIKDTFNEYSAQVIFSDKKNPLA
jgi:hypothetical protein